MFMLVVLVVHVRLMGIRPNSGLACGRVYTLCTPHIHHNIHLTCAHNRQTHSRVQTRKQQSLLGCSLTYIGISFLQLPESLLSLCLNECG